MKPERSADRSRMARAGAACALVLSVLVARALCLALAVPGAPETDATPSLPRTDEEVP